MRGPWHPCWLAGVLALSGHCAAQPSVEINLIAPLDEPRGYCIDLVGYKERARTDRPLQAHTCYGYQGSIAVDQGLDAQGVASGRFRFTHFDMCMSAARVQAGAPLLLAQCAERREQKFDFTPVGEIRPDAAPELCLTIADGKGVDGGGGQPVHLRRALTLDTCAPTAAQRQRWQTR